MAAGRNGVEWFDSAYKEGQKITPLGNQGWAWEITLPTAIHMKNGSHIPHALNNPHIIKQIWMHSA